MGQIISITNMKGGVGKTTLTANLGHCLAKIHKRQVLLVDVDPQFNLTQYCMDEQAYAAIQDDKHKGTVFDVFIPDSITIPSMLQGRKKQRAKEIIVEVRDGLFLLPSSIKLIDFIDQRKSGSERLLQKYLNKIKDNFDFIFIDCPPTSTILSRAAYLASEGFLIPMCMDYFSVMGLPLLQKDINDFTSTYGKELKGLGIVRTKYLDWTSVAKRHTSIVTAFSKALKVKLFDSFLRERKDVINALSDRKFILELGESSDAAQDIKKITKEFLQVAS